MIRLLLTWLVVALQLVLADIPWDKNFFPHRTRAQQHVSASRPLRDLEVTIAAYDGDRQRIGWLVHSPSDEHYRLSQVGRMTRPSEATADRGQTAAEAEVFVLPNFGPSIGNSLRIEGTPSAYLGSSLQLDTELYGGICENCTK